jgi:hypothetical protein
MAMASVPGRPKRSRQDPIAEIRMKRGRQEWFNNFPAIMAALPEEISKIVVQTTLEIGAESALAAPVQPTRGRPWRQGDIAPGTLRRSMRTRFARRRGTDITLTGRIDFKAKDPTQKDPKHTFAKAVEVGSTRRRPSGGHYRVPAQPFLVPVVVRKRPVFVARLMDLESRLPRR